VSETKHGAPFSVLAIDNDPQTLSIIREAVTSEGLEVFTANDSETGLELFARVRPRIVMLSLATPSIAGIELLERMLNIDPAAYVALLVEHYSAESAVDAIQKGACDYLIKPLDVQGLRRWVSDIQVETELRQRTLTLDQALLQACRFEGIVSRSPLMFEVFAKIRRVARHFKTALITGATGTGKELIARSLHRLSPVSHRKFVVCNCASIVETLAETELFGHVKGAFTGAMRDRAGLFESANGGVLFLDEIAELTPATQGKLLRVLQDHKVRRVGSSESRHVDVRVIAATNRDLRSLAGEGRFREDLYYRLAVVQIDLPPLTSRREDLPLLQRHFIEKFAAEYKKPILGVSRRAQARMAVYPWPGNVRELENVFENACMMTEGRFIDINDLPAALRSKDVYRSTGDEGLFSLEEVQKRHVMRVLERVGGNKAQAAEILGIGRATIYELLSRMKSQKTDETA
jgi:DNA-binding NtrC family response regulator